MQKQILLVMIAASLVLACRKQEIQPNVEPTQPPKAFSPSSVMKTAKTTFNDNTCECSGSPSNCAEEVVVRPRRKFDDFLAAANGNGGDIAAYFNTQEGAELFPNLDAQDIALLQSGDYDVIAIPKGNDRYINIYGLEGNLSIESGVEFAWPVTVED